MGRVGSVGSVGSLGRVGSGKKFAELFPTFDCSLFPVPYSLVPTNTKKLSKLFPTAPCSLLPAPYSLFPVPCSLGDFTNTSATTTPTSP
ncbi:MAG: hypothetical protein F6J90_12830 [Moorea sp. SIOASIH]|uniref:hypothetical protein n=1 Tax=Moorena sp. SIOASIH TaxID=2607817 RepID=UPI0013BB0F0E|nr:hypothetical protein [Moorena sp. SIOASIH]NEO37152.1 hypothetical protein [Moorena sp. SIOASIH]